MTDYIKQGLLAAGLLISLYLGYNYYSLTLETKTQALTIANLTSANTILQSNNDVLKRAIDNQNEGITTFRKTAEDIEKRFGTLNTSISQGLDRTNSKIEKAMKQPIPQTCDQTMTFLLDAATSGEFK